MRLCERKPIAVLIAIAFLGAIAAAAVLLSPSLRTRLSEEVGRTKRSENAEGFSVRAGGKEAVFPETGLALRAPEGWIFAPAEKPTALRLRPESGLAECAVDFTHGSSSGTSASGFLQLNDLGPRFGATVTETEQKIIEVSGWDAAFFAWKDQSSMRNREVLLPYGMSLLTIRYREAATPEALGKQPKPCIWDFEWLLTQGISVPH